MSERHTVLVLGAGASNPYGFPLGADLVHKICDEFPSAVKSDTEGRELSTMHTARAKAFCDALLKSHQLSIDSFLEAQKTEFRDLGKEAIARILLPCENESHLQGSKIQDDWYRKLINWLIPPSLGGEPAHKLSIITYNYDRSLEQYFYLTLKHLFNRTHDVIATFMQKVPVIHVHGRFGRLPWERGEGAPLPYGVESPEHLRGVIRHAADNISIIYETDPTRNDPLDRAHQALSEATEVLFLGFGYDKTNLDRLALATWCRHKVVLEGTAYGLTAVECSAKIQLLERQYPYASHVILEEHRDHKNLDFMRNTHWFQ